MQTRQQLESSIKTAKEALTSAESALTAFDCAPENNVFESMENAKYTLEGKMEGWAHADCEGSCNCGSPEYEQEFIVDGVHYKAVLSVEYNRHDKTYYYIEETDFKVEKI